MTATTPVDPELDRLRAWFPVGTVVRVAPGFVDPGQHVVVGHTRPRATFGPVLLLRTPDSAVIPSRADWWRRVPCRGVASTA